MTHRAITRAIRRYENMGQGLYIVTVTGAEFDVHGTVTYSADHNVYYCGGQSWPAEIV